MVGHAFNPITWVMETRSEILFRLRKEERKKAIGDSFWLFDIPYFYPPPVKLIMDTKLWAEPYFCNIQLRKRRVVKKI